MIIKNSGTLGKDYFISYLNLVLNTMNCTVEEAKKIMLERLFKNDKELLGTTSYHEFLEAYEEMRKRKMI